MFSFFALVIPAQAGISLTLFNVPDSRFSGNDGWIRDYV